MTYKEARSFIDESNKYGSKLGLDSVTQLLKRLGNPQEKLKVIHIAGTNGKGSTAAYIASILMSEGYRVGRYLSPAVFSYRERIQINSDYVSEEGVSDAIELIRPLCESMVREGLSHPTTFEIETAMALLYFVNEQVDFAVIEVGMGGRLDATNVMKQPVLSVITSVSMDHMQFLGDTLEKIAREKAGIIKKGVSVITGNKKPEVLKVIREVSEEQKSRLITASKEVTDTEFSPDGTGFCYGGQKFKIKLLGEYQIDNAILAIEAARELNRSGYRIGEDSIKKGLLQAKWSGRLEIIGKNPYFIIDGAHNEDAALQLKSALKTIFPDQRKIFIMGVLADKDYRKILEITAPLASIIYTITPDNLRALASEILAKEARQYAQCEVIDASSVSNAVCMSFENAGKDDLILAFGSLSFLGEMKEYLNKRTISRL